MADMQKPYMSGPDALMYIKQVIRQQFGSDMQLQEEKSAFEHHGWFQLRFWYMPKSYTVQFEGEFNGFNVRITKDDEAFIALNELTDYKNSLTKQNMYDAIEKLKHFLNTEISFYKIINGKRYREICGEYKKTRR